MSYTPTEWKKGDKITAEKMNKLENGVANTNPRVLVFEYEAYPESQDYTLGKVVNITMQEIIDAYENGYFIIFPFSEESKLYYYLSYEFTYNENSISMYCRPLAYDAPFTELILSCDSNYFGDDNIYVTFPD